MVAVAAVGADEVRTVDVALALDPLTESVVVSAAQVETPLEQVTGSATVIAAAAAGLSAAAAWSLTVAPTPVQVGTGLATSTTPVASPAAAPTRAAAPVSIAQVRFTRTVVVGPLGERAESTP